MTTALHNIAFSADEGTCSVGVAFESAIGKSEFDRVKGLMDSGAPYNQASNFTGQFVSDYHFLWADGPGGIPDVLDDWEGVDDAVRSSIYEESPLLANRLYALGLEHWAHPSRGLIRQHLRAAWLFKVSGGSLRAQGNLALESSSAALDSYSARDIAFLDACPLSHSPLQQDKPPSGLFTMDRPAVFFDMTSTRHVDQRDLDHFLLTQPPLFSISQARIPATFEEDLPFDGVQYLSHVVPVIGGPRGIISLNTGAPELAGLRACFEQSVCNRGDSKELRIHYKTHLNGGLCVSTNFDGIAGMSGGHALVKRAGEDGILDGTLQSWALVHGSSYDEADPNFDQMSTTWAYPAPMNGDGAYDTPQNPQLSTHYFPIDRTNKLRSRWDFDINPEDPGAIYAFGEVLPSCTDSRDGQCFSYGKGTLKNAPFGDPPADDTLVFVNPVFVDGTLDDVTGAQTPATHQGPPLDSPLEDKTYRYTCDSHIFSPRSGLKPGAAIGFVGAKSFLYDYPLLSHAGSAPVVGSLRMVCAPWTKTPFTDNWQFLFWTGRKATTDRIKSVNDSPFDLLSRGLTSSFEQRISEVAGTMIRPISMKTCPPNFFLNGFNVIYNQITPGGKYVVGIDSLRCVDTSATPSFMNVCLNPLNTSPSCASSSLDWSSSSIRNYYNVNGNIFSISQEIGNNLKEGSQSLALIGCAQDEVVHSVVISGKSSTVIDGLWVGCIQRPTP